MHVLAENVKKVTVSKMRKLFEKSDFLSFTPSSLLQ